MSSKVNNRIAKNTLMLYIRMFLTLGISLFTTRIILDSLGVTDYGIYSVVGGIVATFLIFANTLTKSTQRFLSFSLGKNDNYETKKTFSLSVIIHGLLAITILIIGETVGLWFLNNKLNIPVERMAAAQLIYQFSLVTSIIRVMQIPYMASIIANEKMEIYAYLSIAESVFKLAIAYYLALSAFDRLITYGFLLLLMQVLIFGAHYFITNRKFAECKFELNWDKSLFKTMLSYSGWNTISGLANVFAKEGVNILLNIFFGPAVNAARGVTMQVNTAVRGFSQNFQVAVNPQIVKLYAGNERKQMFDLIINNDTYDFFLMSLLAVPIIFEIDFILKLWLKEVPEFTSIFIQITILQTALMSLHLPLGMGIHAHGNMKIPNLSVSIVYVLVLPLSYWGLKIGMPEYTPFLITLLAEPVTIAIDLILLKKFIDFPILRYLKESLTSIAIITIALIPPFLLHLNMELGWYRFISVILTSFMSIVSLVFTLGLTKTVKQLILSKIQKSLKLK